MKAMILAAGVGSRLGAETQNRPKALVEAGGRTMIEHVILKLKSAGVSSIIINLHYLSSQIEDFIKRNHSFGLQIEFSREDQLLDTGGGLYNARSFFEGEEMFFLHNCDIYSEIDLAELAETHRRKKAAATLAVMERPSSRMLVFDKEDLFVGWDNDKAGNHLIRTVEQPARLAFSGIHAISPVLFKYMDGPSAKFSIIESYLKAATANERVVAYRMPNYWIDIGKPETLKELRTRLSP